MTEIFKTVLYLSILGAAVVILLLVLKPDNGKAFFRKVAMFCVAFCRNFNGCAILAQPPGFI